MSECLATIGTIGMEKTNSFTKAIQKQQQALLDKLQSLHNDYAKGVITDKAAYKKEREAVLKQLSNYSLEVLISQTSNIYLKNYYSSFLK